MNKRLLIIALAINLVGLSAQVNLSNGLQAYYPFSGNGNDYSGNNNHGTIVGSATVVDTLVIGDNSSDAFSVPYTVINGAADFSYSVRVKFNQFHTSASYNTANNILGGFNALNQNELNTEYIKSRPGESNIMNIYFGGILYQFTSVVLLENIWYHVVVVRNGTSLSFYLDGSLVETKTCNLTPINISPGALIVGQEQDAVAGGYDQQQCTNGKMDELYFFDRALNVDEINYLAQGGALGVEDEIIFGEFLIYPNPSVSDFITIGGNGMDALQVLTVYGMDGRIIESRQTLINGNQLDVSSYSSGVYNVVYTDEFGRRYIQRMLIK